MGDWDFWDWCLAGLGVFGVVLGLAVLLLYVLPREPLVIPEVQSALRLGPLEEMPVNSSRLERWGSELILVVRSRDGELSALAAVSRADGCILRWDSQTQQIHSPCSYLVFNERGGVVAGLDDRPLPSYPVSVRDGIVHLGRSR